MGAPPGFCLRKRFKDPVQLCRCNSRAGIFHRESKPLLLTRARRCSDRQPYLAAMGKLDGITQQIK